MNKCEMEIIEMKSWNKKQKKRSFCKKTEVDYFFSNEIWTEMNLAKLKVGPFKIQYENSISIYFWNVTFIRNFWKFLWNLKSLRNLNLLNFHT